MSREEFDLQAALEAADDSDEITEVLTARGPLWVDSGVTILHYSCGGGEPEYIRAVERE